MSSPERQRRRDEQLEIAALALAHDRDRREDHHRHVEDDADERRHDLHRGAPLRVVLDPHLDRARARGCRRRCAAPTRRLREPFAMFSLPGSLPSTSSCATGRSPSASRRSKSARHRRRRCSPSRGASPRAAPAPTRAVRYDAHDLRRLERRRPARASASVLRLVEHDALEVAHVAVDRVAEHEHLDDRDADDHPQRRPVARELSQLLARDREDACDRSWPFLHRTGAAACGVRRRRRPRGSPPCARRAPRRRPRAALRGRPRPRDRSPAGAISRCSREPSCATLRRPGNVGRAPRRTAGRSRGLDLEHGVFRSRCMSSLRRALRDEPAAVEDRERGGSARPRPCSASRRGSSCRARRARNRLSQKSRRLCGSTALVGSSRSSSSGSCSVAAASARRWRWPPLIVPARCAMSRSRSNSSSTRVDALAAPRRGATSKTRAMNSRFSAAR